MALVYTSYSQPSSIHSSRQVSWITPDLLDRSSSIRSITPVPFDVVLPSELDNVVLDNNIDGSDTLSGPDPPKLTFPEGLLGSVTALDFPRFSLDQSDIATSDVNVPEPQPKHPFRKWMKSLHRRARRRTALGNHGDTDIWHQVLASQQDSRIPTPFRKLSHRHSSSGSSFGFVSAVRSASVSLSSVSAVTRSRRNTMHSQCPSRTDRSSRASMSCPRASEDSALLDITPLVDSAAIERSLQRRRILEELITTEESYIGDIRFLMNVYITILASLPSLSSGLRASINQNLTEIVELHEDILGELHRIVPDSEYTQIDVALPSAAPPRSQLLGHRRLNSLDAVPEDGMATAWLRNTPGMLSEPQIAAEVSKILGKRMNRFFIYKEYGAKYEMMMKDIAMAHRTMPEWESYQKGLETLASTLGTARNKATTSKKSLTIGDLLVKPIQRICKYPLLFSELLKYTPASDCANSHMEVENILIRLREATAEINRATNDARMKIKLERTWLLQDRLVFMNRKLDAASKNQIRSFGHVQLCGTLYICWQTKDGIEGQYLICLLYRNVLCFASAGKVEPIYTILACIDLHRIKVEEVDNGRGLQCHTAPFSWKLVFECDYQLHEVIMTACTAKEEMEWRARLNKCDEEPGLDIPLIMGTLDLNIKSLGTVFGKPGTAARRLSIHRATTVGPKSPLCQVILKNTSAAREATSDGSTILTINRSQSLLATHRIPVLAPPRSERARLEALLTDVWSRDVLPFPGMTTRARGEHLVRSSASSMMRKLSVASIASSFAKRSGSIRIKSVDEATDRESQQQSDNNSTVEEETASGGSVDLDTVTEGASPRLVGDVFDATWTESAGTSGLEDVLTAVPCRRMTEPLTDDKIKFLKQASNSASLRLSLSVSSDKSTPVSLKENLSQQTGEKPRGSSGRWTGISMAKNTGKGHGFRNFFR